MPPKPAIKAPSQHNEVWSADDVVRVLHLRDVEELTWPNIARALNRTAAACKQRYFYTKRKDRGSTSQPTAQADITSAEPSVAQGTAKTTGRQLSSSSIDSDEPLSSQVAKRRRLSQGGRPESAGSEDVLARDDQQSQAAGRQQTTVRSSIDDLDLDFTPADRRLTLKSKAHPVIRQLLKDGYSAEQIQKAVGEVTHRTPRSAQKLSTPSDVRDVEQARPTGDDGLDPSSSDSQRIPERTEVVRDQAQIQTTLLEPNDNARKGSGALVPTAPMQNVSQNHTTVRSQDGKHVWSSPAMPRLASRSGIHPSEEMQSYSSFSHRPPPQHTNIELPSNNNIPQPQNLQNMPFSTPVQPQSQWSTHQSPAPQKPHFRQNAPDSPPSTSRSSTITPSLSDRPRSSVSASIGSPMTHIQPLSGSQMFHWGPPAPPTAAMDSKPEFIAIEDDEETVEIQQEREIQRLLEEKIRALRQQSELQRMRQRTEALEERLAAIRRQVLAGGGGVNMDIGAHGRQGLEEDSEREKLA